MKMHIWVKKQLPVAIALFSLGAWGAVSQAQCLPTESSCTTAPAARNMTEHGFYSSLEIPPQLASEASNAPEVVRGSDWMEQNDRVFIPRGTPSWGAVAKDPNLPGLGGLGVSDNWVSEEDAAWAAGGLCRQNGGQDCYIELTYSNACLAVALSNKNTSFWTTGVTRELAAQSVMQQCSDKSQGQCSLSYARCSYPAQ